RSPAHDHASQGLRVWRFPCPSTIAPVWDPPAVDRGAFPKRKAWLLHRGSCGASLKHRVRDAGTDRRLRKTILVSFVFRHETVETGKSPASRAALFLVHERERRLTTIRRENRAR